MDYILYMEVTSFGLTFRLFTKWGEVFPVDHLEIHLQGQGKRGTKTPTALCEDKKSRG